MWKIFISVLGLVILVGCQPTILPSEDNTYDIGETSRLQEDKCLDWAFGNDWAPLPYSEIDDKWNEHHSDIFQLYGWDDREEAVGRIRQECEKRGI